MKYTIKFEFFGRKMQLTNVEAINKSEAIDFVKNKIIFHDIKNNNPYLESTENLFDKISKKVNDYFDKIK